MARIAGVTLPREKRIEIGLTYVYGIGRSMSNRILAAVKIDPDTHVKDLTEDEEVRLRGYIEENVTVEGDLRRERSQNIKRLMEIGCYRGIRHRRGMPVRASAPRPTRACARATSPRWASRRRCGSSRRADLRGRIRESRGTCRNPNAQSPVREDGAARCGRASR